MKSIFTDKKAKPATADLEKALGSTYTTWENLLDFTCKNDPGTSGDWHFAGEKYGWSFRIRNTKRILVYLLPQDGFFTFSLVLGKKATEEILATNIAEKTKAEIRNTKVYAEGRGVRFMVQSKSIYKDLQQLIQVKIAN